MFSFKRLKFSGKVLVLLCSSLLLTRVESLANGFGAYEAWTSEPYYGNRGTVFADVDGDGRVDAIVVNDGAIVV